MEEIGRKLRDLELEMRGRMMALETIQLAVLAHMAAITDEPTLFVSQIMEKVEQNLNEAEQQAASIEARSRARHALLTFHSFTGALLAHINRTAKPAGTA